MARKHVESIKPVFVEKTKFVNSKLITYSIVFMALVLLVFVLKTFVSFIRPLVFAVLLAILFSPLVNYAKKFKIPSYLTIVLTFAILFIIFYFLTSLIVFEAQEIIYDLPIYQNKLNVMSLNIQNSFAKFGAEIKLTDLINLQNINKILSPILYATKTILSEILLIIIFAIFLIPFYNSLDRKIITLLDPEDKDKFKRTLIKTEESVRTYLLTKTIISLGTGIVSGLLIYLFKSNFSISLALIIFLFNFIPNIGSIVAVFFVSIILLFELGFTLPFFILVALLILTQILFGNILEPLFEGKVLELSPFIIILSLFFWYWVWGIGGMILAVPLTSIIKIILAQIKSTEKYAIFMGP